MTDEADEFIRAVMADMLDEMQSVARRPCARSDRDVHATEQFVLAVDLGTARPQGGAGLVDRQVAWSDHVAVETR